MVLYVYSILLQLIMDGGGGSGGKGYLCTTNYTVRRHHHNDKASLLLFQQLQGTNSCREQSHKDSARSCWEQLKVTRQSNLQRELPSPPRTHSLVSSLKPSDCPGLDHLANTGAGGGSESRFLETMILFQTAHPGGKYSRASTSCSVKGIKSSPFARFEKRVENLQGLDSAPLSHPRASCGS